MLISNQEKMNQYDTRNKLKATKTNPIQQQQHIFFPKQVGVG